jgi:VWFA-related protein
MKWHAAFAACGLLAQATFAQDSRFSAETRVVQVPVTVTGANGRNIDGLKTGDFEVLDEGRRRVFTLDAFGPGAAPISLAIAVQTSALAKPALARIRRIGTLVEPLVIGRRGEAGVLSFDSAVEWQQGFTGNPALIQRAIQRLSNSGDAQSRLLDAVVQATRSMKDRKGRKVLLLVSESKDRGSEERLEEAIEEVEREGVEVFAAPFSPQRSAWTANTQDLPPPSAGNYLSVFQELFRLAKASHTDALTQATGGTQYPFVLARAAEKAIETLGAEVHSQYILSFPPGEAKGMHHIEVRIPDHPEYKLRARQAYWQD